MKNIYLSLDLVEMTFVKREKRFFVRMIYRNNEELVYCPNPGKMRDILIPGSRCLVSAKTTGLSWQWEFVNIENQWIGINTAIPNKLTELLLGDIFPGENFKREVKFGQFRADFASKDKIIEVKNVHWVRNNIAYFPDCVTVRGARQLLDMIELKKQDYDCYFIYILQRNDVQNLTVADDIDPIYAQNAKLAKENGIKFLAFNCSINQDGIKIEKQITVL